MKIQFDPKEFSAKFKLAASVAAARDTKPILQNVKVKADEKVGIILQATDTELGIRIQYGCDVVNGGEAILPTKRLTQILDLTGEEKLTIASTENSTVVSGEKENYKLNTQSPDEFPNVEEFHEESYHEIPAKVLKEMIRRTTFATDTENVRYALGGVYFELIGNEISVVATDGRRLAWQTGKGTCVNDHKVETSILPVRMLQILDRVLHDKDIDDDDDIKMAVSGNRAFFQCKDVTLFSRLVEGRFPKWRGIIPKTDDETPVVIECSELLPAVLRAQITTSELEPGIFFVFEKGRLTLKGEGKEIGDSVCDVLISYDGPKKTAKLDQKYMTSFLRILDAEKVLSIYLPPDNDPIKITTDEGGYVYVVMPMSM